MKKFILITGLLIYALMILIGFAAIAQNAPSPLMHVHTVKNINGKVSVKDTSFRVDTAKIHARFHRNSRYPRDSAMARKMAAGKLNHKTWNGRHPGHFPAIDSISVNRRIRVRGDSIVREVRRIVYFAAVPNATRRKTSDTTLQINITVHNGMAHRKHLRGPWGMGNGTSGAAGANGDAGKNDLNSNQSELSVSNFTVYPNPAAGLFKINFSLPDNSGFDIKVSDMSGKIIWQEHNAESNGNYEKTLDLSTQQKGVYILEIKQNDKSMLKKLVVN